jgi:hypothetical protein
MSPNSSEIRQRITAEQQRLQQGADRTPEAQRASETYIKRVNLLLERIKAARTRMDSDTKMSAPQRQKLEAACAAAEQKILAKLSAMQPALVAQEVGRINATVDEFLLSIENASTVPQWRTGDRVVLDRALGQFSAGGHQLFIKRDGKHYLLQGRDWVEVDPALLPRKGPPAPLSPKIEAEVKAFHEQGAPLSSDTLQRGRRVITRESKEWQWGIHPGSAVVVDTPVGSVQLLGDAEAMSEADAHIIVNALLKQRRIAQTFNVPENMIPAGFKIEAGSRSDMMMNNWGEMYLNTVRTHVERLREKGATDAEIMTELAGHIFHESVHDTSAEGMQQMFRGNDTTGEISTVTAQTAYYLSEGYTGPTSYTPDAVPAGAEKIRATSGKFDQRDYDVATCTAGELIHQRLIRAFPAISRSVQTKNSLKAVYEICKQISAEDRPRLLTALREAMADSCDPKMLQDLQLRLKAPPPPPVPRVQAARSAEIADIAATEAKLNIRASDGRSESDIDEDSTPKVNVVGRR